jgi:hypothetical protein
VRAQGQGKSLASKQLCLPPQSNPSSIGFLFVVDDDLIDGRMIRQEFLPEGRAQKAQVGARESALDFG